MSAAKGSNHFANSRTTPRLLTISLFSVGVILAGVLVYQQFEGISNGDVAPHVISKYDAIQAAIVAGKWDEQRLADKKMEATLLHIKANGFSFIVDEKTLQDTFALHHNKFPEYESRYLWAVEITSSTRDWSYVVDAETGEILLQS